MIKNGRIEIGKTPSPKSGHPCEEIKEGEPVDEGEEPVKRIEKIARMLEPVAVETEEEEQQQE